MLLQKFSVFIFIAASLTVVKTLEEDERFLGEPEYLPEQQNWFRVNRKGGAEEQARPQRDVVVNPSVLEREGEDDEQEQEGESYTRNRRLYTPPAIVRDGGRSSPVVPQRRDGGGDQCRCDMEYVLKYRGVQPRGEYQVKVYHEETGKFTGGEDHDHRHYHQDNQRGWSRGSDYDYVDRKGKALPPAYRNKYEYYTEPPSSSQQRGQQQQQQGRMLQREHVHVQQQERPRYQYYVEEVVDDGGDRGRGGSGERRREELFVRGNGPSKSRVIRRPLSSSSGLRKNRKFVKLARFIVSKAEWGMVAIISEKGSDFGGYPFSEYFRMSDGIPGNGSGIPYVFMRMAVLDAGGDYGDLEISKASITVTLNEDDEDEGQEACSRENSERMVACARVTLSGRIIPVTSTKEIDFAENALMSKHRKLEKDGFFAKLVISQIVVFTKSGQENAQRLDVDEYLDYS